MAKEKFDPIVLDYPFTKAGVVNDFLNATGLNKNFRVVMAQVEIEEDDYTTYYPTVPPQHPFKRGGPEPSGRIRTMMRVGLEPLDSETDFYWQLRGAAKLREAIEDYLASRPFNKGVS